MKDIVRWTDVILASGPSDARWREIFAGVKSCALEVTGDADLEQALDAGDRILSDAAWDLWNDFASCAPKAASDLVEWWQAGPRHRGRALLILDAVSVREMRTIVREAQTRGVIPQTVEVTGASVPTDTTAFAHALGLSQRSQLTNGFPKGFALAADSPTVGVPDGVTFRALADSIGADPYLVYWYPWLDDFIHAEGSKPNIVQRLAKIREVLAGDDFWFLVDRLRQGRELLITSDHGYSISQRFGELPSPLAEQIRAIFGAQRCGPVPPVEPHFSTRQPLYVWGDGRAAVIGPWKWKVPGGFPHVSHGGMTLGEACVPFITFAAT